MLGVMGGARVYAAGARVYASLVILVSALGPRGLDLDLDQGLTINYQLVDSLKAMDKVYVGGWCKTRIEYSSRQGL